MPQHFNKWLYIEQEIRKCSRKRGGMPSTNALVGKHCILLDISLESFDYKTMRWDGI